MVRAPSIYLPTTLMEDIFGENGLIARYHDAYEHREGQVRMADAVLRAFEKKRHLVVEAGT